MPRTPSTSCLLLALAAGIAPWPAPAADIRLIEPPSLNFAPAVTGPAAAVAPEKASLNVWPATVQTETVAVLAADGSVRVQCRGNGLRDFRRGPVMEQER